MKIQQKIDDLNKHRGRVWYQCNEAKLNDENFKLKSKCHKILNTIDITKKCLHL